MHRPAARWRGLGDGAVANAAWLTCAAISHNLLRAAGCLASAFHTRASGHTLRRHLINVPARIARGHLPAH